MRPALGPATNAPHPGDPVPSVMVETVCAC